MTKATKYLFSSLTFHKLEGAFFLMLNLTSCGAANPSYYSSVNFRSDHLENFYGLLKSDYFSISSGTFHTCAINGEGVKCWGWNQNGQTNVPSGLKNPQSVSAGTAHSCAIDDEGVKCWGNNYYGQTTVPGDLRNPRSVSAGEEHTCAIDDEGIKCWGDGYDSQTLLYGELRNPRSVSVGKSDICVLDNDGVKCWRNYYNGSIYFHDFYKNPKSVSVGGDHKCVIDDKGVECWGLSDIGQATVPEGLMNPLFVSAGSDHTCAIHDDGVKCWGSDAYGQTMAPEGLRNPRSVSSGGFHTCAIDDEGVKCWGSDVYGQTNVPSPFSNELVPWPQILSQFTTGDKYQLFTNIQYSIFATMPHPALIVLNEHQLLVHLMSRYIKEFPSHYFRREINPKWQAGLKNIEKKTGIKKAADIPQTPATLTVTVKLLNAAFVAVKPMLSGPEQREVDEIILKIDACLSGEMTQASAQGLVKEIRKHQTLMNAIAESEVVHLTSVVVDDATRWIMKE